MTNCIIKLSNIILSFFLLSFTTVNAQSWQWVKYSRGNTPKATGYDVKTGADNNIYCVGEFQPGQMIFETDTVEGYGAWNIFICKYQANGTFEKAVVGKGHTSNDAVGSRYLIVDEQNNVIITGGYSGVGIGGGATIDSFNFMGSASIMARFNNNLQCQSVKKYTGIAPANIIKYRNSFFMDARFSNNGGYVDNFTLANADHKSKMCILKTDVGGTCNWVKQTNLGNSWVRLNDVKNDKLFLWGTADSCFVFDTANICKQFGESITCVVQCDTNGNIKWLTPISSKNFAVPCSVKADSYGNTYIVGRYDSTVQIGNSIINALPNIEQDGFFAKLDSTGALVWIHQFFSTDNLLINSSYTDNDGNTYITGSIVGSAIFGTDTISIANGMFVARYDKNGVCLGVKIVADASGLRLTQDSSGNAIITGQLNGITDFDNIHIPQTGAHFFLAKLSAIMGGTPVERIARDEGLKIYPNPNAQAFTIEVPETLVGSSRVLLDIYDSNGKMIKEETTDISNNRVNVDMGTIQKGIYTVTLSNGKKRYTGRVVVN